MTSINANIPRKGRNHKLAGPTPAVPIFTKHFRGSVATNQTTADVKERNHPIAKSTTAATWDYQYFACELVSV